MSSLAPPIDDFPRLVVRSADKAIAFVQTALNGTLVEQYADLEGRVAHAKLSFGQVVLSIIEEVPEWGWLSPGTLGGSPVMMQLDFENCDLVADRMEAQGAVVVVPIENRAYGRREGRLRDPFGHLWILRQSIST